MSNQQRAHDFAIAVVQSLIATDDLEELKQDLDLINDPSQESLFNVYIHAYNSFLNRLEHQD
ncbi:hypothetical protein [Limosilactobacillus reuteri]|uniref:hypothetical protein n=1 Tax=Limosilactobacillus reuteri TaxID=1598 RepID=UPI002B059C36|nr:hypothetical protein [Limosilactobacillus reuteri]